MRVQEPLAFGVFKSVYKLDWLDWLTWIARFKQLTCWLAGRALSSPIELAFTLARPVCCRYSIS